MKLQNYKFILASFNMMILSYMLQAAPLQLTDEPLFLNQSVPPALAITFDDSGSMAWGFMPDTRTYYNAASLSSPDYNFIYYNPNIDYKPPVRSDGSQLPNSNFFRAKFDGYYQAGTMRDFNGNSLGNVDLSRNYIYLYYSYPDYTNGFANVYFLNAGRNRGPAYYHKWNGPTNATLNNMGPAGVGPNSYQYSYVPIGPSEQQNFANWYTYYNTRGKLARAAVSHAFVNFGPDFKIDWQQINNLQFPIGGGTNMKLFTGKHRQNFYDWLFHIPANGGTPLRQSYYRAGELFRKGGVNGPYYDSNFGAELSCQQNFHIAISDGTWNGWAQVGGNPDNSNRNFPLMPDGTTRYSYNPSKFPAKMYHGDEKQTLADHTFEYWSTDLRTDLPNEVPVFIDDYTDRYGNTIVVPTNKQWWQDPALFWNPKNDPANWQHMVNFNIGLGIKGQLDRNTDLPRIRKGAISWPSINSNGGLVDDVWHSAINSRGKYFSARDPAQLSSALNKVVTNIVKRTGRASAGSVSSNIISSKTLAFKTGYDTSDWSGFVIAQTLNPDGSLGAVKWDAACKLTGGPCPSIAGSPFVQATRNHATRNIFTYDPLTKFQHPFHTVNMSRIEQDAILNSAYFLNQQNPNLTNPFATPTPFNADDVIRFIRGDRLYEQQNGGMFRNRKNLLGDVIHSPAVIVRGPSSIFDDNVWNLNSPERIAADTGHGYEVFKEANKLRDNILLVGSNDGMLHAFDAGINTTTGGDELWAFVPSKALEGISELANPAYRHKSFVDSSVFVQDAYIKQAWTTVALGNMRHGGQLFYALDMGTDPKNQPTVLWEFSDKDDVDMGYTYAGGIVIRAEGAFVGTPGLQTKWVAILPNGYNSSNQKSVMYAIDLETGTVLHKWNTGVGSLASPNGMGPPVASDFIAYPNNNDVSSTLYGVDYGAEYVYAGDLHGNVYRFALSDIFSGKDTIETLFKGTTDQPITIAPRLFSTDNNSSNIVVVFGTGKYLEAKDRSVSGSSASQYLFGLKDKNVAISSAYTLNDSRIIEQFITTSNNFRSFTNKTVDVDHSWKIRLPVSGERIVNVLQTLGNHQILAGSIIPNGGDPCISGGSSWLMFMDARTGSTFGSRVLNNGKADGVLINDLLVGVNVLNTVGGNQTIISVDGAGGGAGSGNLKPIVLDVGEKWRRRSWHRILFD